MNIDTFVEDCEEILANCSLKPLTASVARPGSFWLSCSTGRRCVVLWSSTTAVCVSFDESDMFARKQYTVEDFTLLYTEAR